MTTIVPTFIRTVARTEQTGDEPDVPARMPCSCGSWHEILERTTTRRRDTALFDRMQRSNVGKLNDASLPRPGSKLESEDAAHNLPPIMTYNYYWLGAVSRPRDYYDLQPERRRRQEGKKM